MGDPGSEESLAELMPQIVRAALEGKRGKDQRRIAAQAMACLRLLLQKNHDYGCSVWKVPRFAPDCSVGAAILVRLTDKVERLERLASRRAEVTDESFDDTIWDLIGYGILWLARPPELVKPSDPLNTSDR